MKTQIRDEDIVVNRKVRILFRILTKNGIRKAGKVGIIRKIHSTPKAYAENITVELIPHHNDKGRYPRILVVSKHSLDKAYGVKK